jgi:hypothetical protein
MQCQAFPQACFRPVVKLKNARKQVLPGRHLQKMLLFIIIHQALQNIREIKDAWQGVLVWGF